jgi:hypothetical protein
MMSSLDIILMFPPFALSGSTELAEVLSKGKPRVFQQPAKEGCSVLIFDNKSLTEYIAYSAFMMKENPHRDEKTLPGARIAVGKEDGEKLISA